MIEFDSMNDNVVTSDKVAPKKATRKKVSKKVTSTSEETVEKIAPIVEKSDIPNRDFANSSGGKKFVYFSSGSAYVTKSGFRFTREKRIYALDEEEANTLLELDNFRLPDQLELEEYYKENS